MVIQLLCLCKLSIETWLALNQIPKEQETDMYLNYIPLGISKDYSLQRDYTSLLLSE